jgi:phosphoribosylanthranilate isomerase
MKVKMKVKICGITNLEDALLCERLGADMLGFIFYDRSKRCADRNITKEIIRRLSARIEKIGVFVNESADTINETAEKLKLSSVQLHGDEPADQVSKIYFPVIKSFRIKDNFNFPILEDYKNAQPLLDTFSKEQYGGTGKSFNWEKIPADLRSRIILAGGISASNIIHIKSCIKPYAVDVSSSLESNPGKKDHKKVFDFFNLVNSLHNTIK